jgi:RNA polymerase sigma-70 factor (ECF subfamily)
MFSNNPEEVADLFQEILINLWKGFPQFRGESNVRTWIYRVSLNTCISSERKKSRKVDTLPLTMDIDLFSDSDEDTKQVQMLRDRINKLGPFDRAIVLLWLENLSYDEIGAIVGISAKNVSVRLVRIKEQLKNMSN